MGTPEFAIEQLSMYEEGGVSNRSNLLDASTRNKWGRFDEIRRTFRKRSNASFPKVR